MRFIPILWASLMIVTCGCSREPNSRSEKEGGEASCVEPENRYTPGSGHYAGYEWAEHNGGGDCNGRSQSFNEGCEEYEQQESAYEECQRRTK